MSRELRDNDVCVFVAPPELVTELSSRLESCVPQDAVVRGTSYHLRTPSFVNPRFRVYRYAPPAAGDIAGQRFGPHHDGGSGAAGVSEGALSDDVSAGTVRSLMSVLLYLTGGHTGGETVFYPEARVGPEMPTAEALGSGVRVAPVRGSALVFWHGSHESSPLHEGAPLTEPADGTGAGLRPKFVIRTDVLFSKPSQEVDVLAWTESSKTSQAMLRAVMLSQAGVSGS